MYIPSFYKETYFQVQATNSSSVQVGTYTAGLFPMGLVTQDKRHRLTRFQKNDDEARLTKRVPIAIMSCNSLMWNKSDPILNYFWTWDRMYCMAKIMVPKVIFA